VSEHTRLVVAGLLYCPQCEEGRKGRASYAGHIGGGSTTKGRRRSMSEFIGRKVRKAVPAPGDPSARVGELSGLCPAIGEWLTCTEGADGKPRQTATVLVFTEGGLWKCCFRDRDGGEVAFLSGQTPLDLLTSLEAGLVANSLDWRPERSGQRPGRK
jgi:hypothetical protein